MSDLSNFMLEHKFLPSHFDSVLNPHSHTSDNSCNIDLNLECECKYYDSNSIINDGALRHDNFSLFHQNARSLNNKASTISDYISILDHNFDIIAFTETWFNSSDESNLIDLGNYDKIDCIRPDRRGGGASLFINSKHNFSQRPDLIIYKSTSLWLSIHRNPR